MELCRRFIPGRRKRSMNLQGFAISKMRERHKERDKPEFARETETDEQSWLALVKVRMDPMLYLEISILLLFSRRTISFEAVSLSMHESLNIYSNIFFL